MGFVLLTALIASLVLIANCQSANQQQSSDDDDLAQWILDIVNKGTKVTTTTTASPIESTTKFNLSPPVYDSSVYCTTRDNNIGRCVSYYRCKPQTKGKSNGTTRAQSRRNLCPNYLQICCNDEDIEISTPSRATTASDARMSRMTQPTSNIAQRAGGSDANEPVCGLRNPGAFKKTQPVGDEAGAEFADFPWMVAILKKSGNSVVWSQNDYVGGGTLIHPSVVMTVAHKMAPFNVPFVPSQLKCRAGEWDTQTDLEEYPHQERDVKKFVIHKDYYRTSLYNDIVLLVLEQPFQLEGAPHIGTGCLAPSSPPPGRVCYSMGWGRNDPNNKKKFANVLKKVLLHPVERANCQKMLRENSRLGPLFEVHESLTCACGDTNVDSCRGDGGSSMVCAVSDDPAERRFAVHGMVAYGTKCFDPNIPGMYADTAYLKSWVDEKMQEEGFDSKFYTM